MTRILWQIIRTQKFDPFCGICDSQRNVLLLINCHKPLCPFIDLFFILRPELTPLHIHYTTTGSLTAHETLECIHIDSTTAHTANCGETRIIPSGDASRLHKPSELPFTHHGIHEVHTGKGLDPHATQFQGTLNPLILLVAIIVFGGTESVTDPLDGIDDGASQIISGVGFVGSSRTMVWSEVLTIQNGIAHGSIVSGHVDLGTETPWFALFLARAHEVELLECLSRRLISMFRVLTFHSLFLHLFLRCIVHVCEAVVDHPKSVLFDGFEVVGGKGDNVGTNSDFGKVFDDGLLILVLFF
mmetsp:Transcript_16828/g.34097  ORF Transcript_16828/g.34097 Transcript_16828/m.34097 type:complete len:300 (-) Transcript_16828:1038-1937(-)